MPTKKPKKEALTKALKFYSKYKNPDKRCTYPFSPESLGYCWTYATYVDDKISQAEIAEECAKSCCEYWQENKGKMIKLTCAICGKPMKRDVSYREKVRSIDYTLYDEYAKMPSKKSYKIMARIIHEKIHEKNEKSKREI